MLEVFAQRKRKGVNVALIALLLCCQVASGQETTTCRKVDRLTFIRVNPSALTALSKIGYGEEQLFEALLEASTPEALGCWGAVSGNFDDALLSAGVLQWNLGSKTLQPLLHAYKGKFSPADFSSHIAIEMPAFGKDLFSSRLGCLEMPVWKSCRDFILANQLQRKVKAAFKRELIRLFETDVMIQIQVDEFVRRFTGAVEDIDALFPSKPSPLQVKWALDMRVQGGGLPPKADLQRVRERHYGLAEGQRLQNVRAVIDWYIDLCKSADQDGVRNDCYWNCVAWNTYVETNAVTDEQADMLLISHIRSRSADSRSGLFQADFFQRKAQIIFGVGSVHGRQLPEPQAVSRGASEATLRRCST